MSPPPKLRLRTAIVPRVVLTGAFVAVVPACVVAATTEGCGDSAGQDDRDVFTNDVSANFDVRAADASDEDVFTYDVSAHFDAPLDDVSTSDAGDASDDAPPDADDAG